MKKVLLYSGGMDSWLIDKLWHPDVKLYIDVKSRYSKQERRRLPKDVEVVELDLSRWEREDGILPMRNLIFVTIASLYGEDICLGATNGDRILDKSSEFAEQASTLLSYLWQPQHWTEGKAVRVNVDYRNRTKAELLREYISQGGSLEEAYSKTYSCYNPGTFGIPCGACKACYRKAVAFLLNGYVFPPEMNARLTGHLCRVVEQIKAGELDRGKENKDFIEAYGVLMGGKIV